MKKGLGWLLSTAVISGISIFINKFAVSSVSPVALTFMKNAAVAIMFLALIIGLGAFNRLRVLSRDTWAKLALIGLIGGGIPFILFFKGLALTSAASASFIQKSLFVFVIALSALFLKEMPSRRIMLAGSALLAGNWLLLNIKKVPLNFGDMLILIAALLWAGEFILSKKLLENIKPVELAFGRMFFGSIVILAYAIAFEGGIPLAAFSVSSLTWVAITGAFLFAYVGTWYTGLAKVTPAVASIVLMLGSPITTLLSAFSGSPVTVLQWLGFGLIVAGVAVVVSRFSLLRTPNAL